MTGPPRAVAATHLRPPTPPSGSDTNTHSEETSPRRFTNLSTTQDRAGTGERSPTGAKPTTGRRLTKSRLASSTCGEPSERGATARTMSSRSWPPPVPGVQPGVGSARFSAAQAKRPDNATTQRTPTPRPSAGSRSSTLAPTSGLAAGSGRSGGRTGVGEEVGDVERDAGLGRV